MNSNSIDASNAPNQALRTAERAFGGAGPRDNVREAETRRPVQAPVNPQAMEAQEARRETQAQDARRELYARLERIAAKDTRLTFQVDDDSGHTVITVRDASTSEVLKQIPSEEMLNVARRLEAHLSESADGSGVLLADEV